MPKVPTGGLVVVVARSNIVTVRRTVPAVPPPKSSRNQSVPAAFGVRVIEPLSPIITSLDGLPPANLAPTGTLRAAFLATNPVQGRIDPRTGEVTGPIADLVHELARRLGVPSVILPEPNPAAVIERVKSHQADIGFLAYEAARAAQVEFSDPYALVASAYLVRSDSPIRATADIDRAGVTIGAAKAQSQEIYVTEHIKLAHVAVLPETPGHEALVAMLTSGKIDAFAANRQRMEEAAKTSTRVRVLPDNFLMIGQAIVVEKGQASSLDEVNRFVADVRTSGFVKSSLDRAKLAGRFPPRVRARELWRVPPEFLDQAQADATLLAIRAQEDAGLDIITDGEIRRESYSNRFATALEGVDIDNPGTGLDLGTNHPRLRGHGRGCRHGCEAEWHDPTIRPSVMGPAMPTQPETRWISR